MDKLYDDVRPCDVLLVGEQTAHVARLAAGLHTRGVALACLDGERLARCLCDEYGIVIPNFTTPKLHLRGRYRFAVIRAIEVRARRAYVQSILQAARPGIIHINSIDPAHAALLDCDDCPPIVATVWGTDVHTIAQDGTAVQQQAITRILESAAVITADSPHMLDLTAELVPALTRDGLRLAFFGIDTSVFRSATDASSANWRRELAIPDGDRIVLAPRRINPRYSPERVVEAFARMNARRHSVLVFKLLGDNPIEEPASQARLMDLAEARGVADRVRFAPPCPYDQLPGLYAAADVACFLLDRDGTPSTAFELWAAGTPMVVADIPHYRGILDSENASLVPPADPEAAAHALDELLDQGRKAEELVSTGRKWLECHATAEAMLDAMQRAYALAGLTNRLAAV